MYAQRALVLLVAGVLGCGNASTGTVSGVVKLDGQPLAKGLINFQPFGDKLNPGPGSSGRTNEKGEFSLMLATGGPGAIVGKHKVEISAFNEDITKLPDDDKPRPNLRNRVPPKFNIQSTLTFEVKAGSNTADFDLKTK